MRPWLLVFAIVIAGTTPARAEPGLSAVDDRSIEVYAQLAWAGWAFSSGDDRWNPSARVGFGRYRRTEAAVRGVWAAYEVSALSLATASVNAMYIGRRSGGGYAGVLADLETGRFGLQVAGCVSLESSRRNRDRSGAHATFRPCLELQLRDRPAGAAVAVVLSTSIDILGHLAALRWKAPPAEVYRCPRRRSEATPSVRSSRRCRVDDRSSSGRL